MRAIEPISIPEDFWLRAQVLEVLRARDVGALFGHINLTFDASQMRIGAAVGMEQNQVCRIMKGDMRVRHLDVFERIADGLQMSPAARVALGLAATKGEARKAGGRADDSGTCTPGLPTDNPIAATPTHEEILAMTIRRARLLALRAGHYVAPEAIEQIHGDTTHLATAYPQQSLIDIFSDIAETQNAIFSVLEAPHRPADARQLYLYAGAVCGMLAKAAHDMGNSHGALTHARTAFLCAEHADHDGLRAWVMGLQSFIAYWASRPHDSLRYAEDGARFAERSGSTTRTWLLLNRARAWAALGNTDETMAAIRQAEDAREHIAPDDLDQLGGICTFGPSRQLYYAADALARLPTQTGDAERYSLLAVDAYEDTSATDWSFSDQAGSAADLAIARIRTGELDGAADALTPVLELPPGLRINGIVASVERVQEALRTAPECEARRNLQQEIEAFMRLPLAAQLA